jgi:hypothetical protein
MSDEIDVRVSLDLDPEAAMGTIQDYDDDTASYVSVQSRRSPKRLLRSGQSMMPKRRWQTTRR